MRKNKEDKIKSYEKLEALSTLLKILTSVFLLLAILTKRVFFAVSFVITGVSGLAVVIWSMMVEKEEEEEED